MANNIRISIKNKLGKHKLFYVCKDIERAETGLDLKLKNYKIITNNSPLACEMQRKYKDSIIIIKNKDGELSTTAILKTKKVLQTIKKQDFVLVFKNTSSIEKICKENNWQLLNPSVKLASEVEEKISQVNWLDDLKKYLPLTKIDILKNIKWDKKEFILQFNHSHTGSGTLHIQSKKQLDELKKKFPKREVRLSKFIDGPIFTSNNIVWENKTLVGNISYQITGLKPFTDNAFATIGNDWALPKKLMTPEILKQYKIITKEIGKKLNKSGWKGLFGIDLVVDKKTKKVFLIEINARQPASTSCESILQYENNKKEDKKNKVAQTLTIFEAHLAALLDLPNTKNKLINIKNGAQIIQRVTKDTPTIKDPLVFKPLDIRWIRYDNTKLDSDLLRVQTDENIMSNHNELSANGNELSIFISFTKKQRIFSMPRAGIIIIKNNKILLLKRHRNGYDYFVVPGGTQEEGETLQTTAIREIQEETSLTAQIDKKKKPIKLKITRDEIYYFAKDIKGIAELGGPEKESNHPQNSYELIWMDVKKLEKINLLPKALKDTLI